MLRRCGAFTCPHLNGEFITFWVENLSICFCKGEFIGRKSEEYDPRYNISTTPAQIYREYIPYAVEPPPPLHQKQKSTAAVLQQLLQLPKQKCKKQWIVIGSKERLLCVSFGSLCAPPCSDLSCSHMTGPAQNTGIQMLLRLFSSHINVAPICKCDQLEKKTRKKRDKAAAARARTKTSRHSFWPLCIGDPNSKM